MRPLYGRLNGDTIKKEGAVSQRDDPFFGFRPQNLRKKTERKRAALLQDGPHFLFDRVCYLLSTASVRQTNRTLPSMPSAMPE